MLRTAKPGSNLFGIHNIDFTSKIAVDINAAAIVL